MDYNDLYWIFIAESLGYGTQYAKNILDYYGNAENFYRDKANSWRYSGIFTSNNIDTLNKIDLSDAYKIKRKCEKLGYKIVTIENPKYPDKLRNINNPPAVLYVNGELPDLDNRLSISIVGTRSSSVYGNKVSFEMGYNLARVGAIVVSGAAIGIDSIAQKGAMQGGGKTVAVLGCGLNFRYLATNKNLRENVIKNGALISEYPPDYSVSKWTFPVRNRIIAGLSNGTLVVEAREKSGSLITANLALEQNRDLFAIPGNIYSSTSNGTNKLIQICAKPVMNINDILDEYCHMYSYLPDKRDKKVNNSVNYNKKNESKELNDIISDNSIEVEKTRKVSYDLSRRAKLILDQLTDKPACADYFVEKTGLSISEILQAMTELELYELVKVSSGERYSKI